MTTPAILTRKADHLELCAGDGVAFRSKTTLLEAVELVHCSLPEMHLDEVDTSIELFGKRLAAPIIVAGMTGGTASAGEVNRAVARAVEELGLGLGLGSQRAMLEHAETRDTFDVRAVAPTALVIGNLGMVQAARRSSDELWAMCRAVGADALAIHLNPAMEAVQAGGDSDFRGGVELFARLVRELPVPVLAKETGCGLSRRVGQRLRAVGVKSVDVSGAGGTSWVAVEAQRAPTEALRALAAEFWDWGIPTAASLVQLRGLGLQIIATGGVRTGTDVSKALALGAHAAGIAGSVLKAQRSGGHEAIKAYLQGLIDALKVAMLLTGSRTVADLRQAAVVLREPLRSWQAGGGS